MDKNHPEVKFGKTGVLIINLGTPNSTSWWDIRKYLKEFLSDRRVIEVNPILWQVILNLIILTFRPSKTAHAYKKIWRKDTNESPLLYFTRSQAKKLHKKIGSEKIIVDFLSILINLTRYRYDQKKEGWKFSFDSIYPCSWVYSATGRCPLMGIF